MKYKITFGFCFRVQERYVRTEWQNVIVGDIIHLSCNEIIPADVLLLRSSDQQGVCFVETSNLDGESNLKQRQVISSLQEAVRFNYFINKKLLVPLY